jgi:hypothetical protein
VAPVNHSPAPGSHTAMNGPEDRRVKGWWRAPKRKSYWYITSERTQSSTRKVMRDQWRVLLGNEPGSSGLFGGNETISTPRRIVLK